ncbi:MAG: LytTR family DNA-binding domain-containing protein [Lachnospiraceae bacterium]|nr:LytTR family DNA-binding domain-containing protein [Lachnospiraceae bacterium]
MHIAVCDDNTDELAHIASLLEHYRREYNSSITYETFYSATELLETMKTRRFDLLFLDILMPGVNGIDAAREIRCTDEDIPIFFLTASREFAIESYRVNAEDYMMKPAKEEEIFSALDKQLARLSENSAYLILKITDGIVKLPLSQIVFVEVLNHTVYFTLKNGAVREVTGSLSDYESTLLTDPAFYKPHRSYVVNLEQVVELSKKGFFTTVGKTVPIARDTFSKTKAAYMKYMMGGNGGCGI